MMDLREYRGGGHALADWLPWAALVAPGVVLNKDGSFQRSARFRGLDLDSAEPADLAAAAARVNAVLRGLGSGWALFCEARRMPALAYPEAAFPDPVSALADEERRAAFEAGAHFESRYVLTFLWRAPAERGRGMRRWFLEGEGGGAATDWRAELAAFADRTDRVLAALAPHAAELAWMDDAETLGYLAASVGGELRPLATPEVPECLDVRLAGVPLVTGLAPRLGEAHLRVLTVTGLPAETWPGLLDDLNRLAFPCRWMTRAILLDRQEAARLVGRIRRQWFAKRKSVAALLQEALTQEPAALVDTDAENKAADADAALQDLGADAVSCAYLTAAIVVWDRDRAVADARLRQVERVVQGRDLACRIEGLNAVEAWLGTIPGQVYANVRQPPVSTLNLAHMLPLSAPWAGPERNPHLGGPCLLQARTAGAAPFRLSLHVGDVGHALVVGPTGAGKSVLLALLALQFRRYPGARVFAFDHGGSIRAAVLAMGGAWAALGEDRGGAGPALQPLAGVDQTAERAWAAGWAEALLAREGVGMDPGRRARLWSALESLGAAAPAERTLSGLQALLQDAELKAAIAPYTLTGPFGRLLDAEAERLAAAEVQAFETEGLLGTAAAPAVLDALFHRLEARLDGRPALILVDEAWLALGDPAFAPRLRAWLKTLRKRNASVVLATQSLADLQASPLAPVLVESCPARIFLPNPRAREPAQAALYRSFGLTDRQLAILAEAQPKRDYWFQSPEGARLFDLELGAVARALCVAGRREDQAAMDRVLAAAGPQGFPAAWLRERGLGWAAELVEADQAVAPLRTCAP
ncbi:conjugal transfer protein TrbE [Phenylobacterium sp.]|uniref:conjugal transfer protein TrbE n=1 Tax=Phenylobacterium sp. TaxID=1871053 RepID=UPI0035B1D7D5